MRFFFFQAEDGIRDLTVTGVQTCALPISAFAQKRELTFLSWNHFVPVSDDELRRQAEAFGKLASCEVRVDTIAHLQMPAKIAAEAQSQSGHDMYRTAGADAFLYEHLHANVDDGVEKLGKQDGRR